MQSQHLDQSHLKGTVHALLMFLYFGLTLSLASAEHGGYVINILAFIGRHSRLITIK